MLKPIERSYTWAEYLAAFDDARDWISERRQGHADDWMGPPSFRAARALARDGWADGAQYIRSVALPALARRSPVSSDESTWQWDVTGANYDVGEYLSGVPECWMTREPSAARPVVTLQSDAF